MNLIEINKRLRQRPPFQMIERITELDPGKTGKGIKCVSVNEPYFIGHFPDAPIMPGVLVIECAAQLCSLIMPENTEDKDKIYVLLKVKDFKFLKPVIPGDSLEIEAKVTMSSSAAYEFYSEIRCGREIKAKGTLLFTSVDKEAVYG